MLTSSNVVRDVAAGYRFGANSYVQKPVDFAEFRAVVRLLGVYWLTINVPPPHTEP
jgi:two-component system response regulator